MAEELRGSRIETAPKFRDTERAKDILDEIQALCKARGVVMAHTKHGIVLAKYNAPPEKCRILGVVRQITPNFYQYNEATGDLIGDDILIHIAR